MKRLRFSGRGKALVLRLGILLGTLLALAIPGAAALAQAAGQWQLTGSMATGHSNWYNGGFAQLPDGRVLAISGSPGPGALTTAADIYDPGTGQWMSAGTLNDARFAFGPPSVLADGDVLGAGGHDVNVVDYATAELYDPATNQWTFTGSLNTARRYPIQVELANGEVLAATGSFGAPTCTRYLSSAELYNPATGQWTYTGSTLVPRESATAIRLADGRVLLAGGYNGGGGACTDTGPVDTETYDPSTGQWSFAGSLPHGWLGGTMVLLKDGRVLMVDGNQVRSGPFAEAVIFDPSTGQWSEAATPLLPRSGAAATVLPDGKVLVSQGGQLQSEIYDPVANTWSLDATALDQNNNGHTFLLPDGQVLLAGGADSSGAATTAELYTQASSDNDLAIAAHADVTANATSPSGATLTYSPPTVTDPDDATSPAPSCSPASVSLFPVGTTMVTCTATDPDDSNSPVTTSFAVTVQGAAAQLAALHQAVQGVGPGTSLADKISQAQAYVAAGDSTDAISTLTAFINEVQAQAGKHIPSGQASQLIADAKQIQAVLGSLILGTWPGTTGPAAAATYYAYPYPSAPVCPPSGGSQCVPDQWNFYQGQCTSWVAYRLNQLNGFAFSNSFGGNGNWGNAMNWGPHAQSLGIAVNGTPAVGSVAWWPDSSAHVGGHVAYVEKVNSPTSIVISEMNYDDGNGFRVSTITSSSANWPAGFIHIHDR